MALCQVQFFSRTLNVASTALVILPEPNMGIGVTASGTDELPQVLYLLHGYSDDHSIWLRRTSIERYAAGHNLAVIMPFVNHSFYCNEAHGERYWDYVSQELPETMHSFFRLSCKSEDTYVAGLSMGGYGAMRLALTFPERYAAAASFSGAVDLVSRQKAVPERFENLFGTTASVEGTEVDLFHLMKVHAADAHKPRLYVSCGTADFLYDAHQRFCPALKKAGWDVTTQEIPDAVHSWDLWDRQVAVFLENYIR